MISPIEDFSGAGSEGFLHTFVHAAKVATVSGQLNALAEGQPIVVCTASSSSLSITSGLFECSKYMYIDCLNITDGERKRERWRQEIIS